MILTEIYPRFFYSLKTNIRIKAMPTTILSTQNHPVSHLTSANSQLWRWNCGESCSPTATNTFSFVMTGEVIFSSMGLSDLASSLTTNKK